MTDCKPGQKYRQIEKTHVSPWEQHSHLFTRHIDVSPIRSHIVHLHRAGCSMSLLMRPGQLFRPHALPCLFYARQNVDPSAVSLYAFMLQFFLFPLPLLFLLLLSSPLLLRPPFRFFLASSARRCLSLALAAFLPGSWPRFERISP